MYLLANTFDKKPEESNDRPRHPMLAVTAPGRFGAAVSILDQGSKPLASQRIGFGPVADTVYFGYRSPVPSSVELTTVDGNQSKQNIPSGTAVQRIVFK